MPKTLDLSSRANIPSNNQSVPSFTRVSHANGTLNFSGAQVLDLFSPSVGCTVKNIVAQLSTANTVQLLVNGEPISALINVPANSLMVFPGVYLPNNAKLSLSLAAAAVVTFDVPYVVGVLGSDEVTRDLRVTAFAGNIGAGTKIVQSATASRTNAGTTIALTFAQAVTPGNHILLYIQQAGGTVASVADGTANVYSLLATVGGRPAWLYSCQNAAAFTTLTVTNSADFVGLVAVEIQGSFGVDGTQYAVTAQLSNTVFTSGNITTSQTNDFIVLFGGSYNGGAGITFTPGTGFALVTQRADVNTSVMAETKLQAAAATIFGNFVVSSALPGTVAIVAIKSH